MALIYHVLVLLLVLVSNSVIKCTPVELENDQSDEYENFNRVFANATRNGVIQSFEVVINILTEWLNSIHNTNSETETCGNRIANRPRQDANCYYLHRSSEPLYCRYSLLWGNATDDNK